MMFVAAVWEVALRFVSTATGIKPNTAIKQKAAIPRASVTSTRKTQPRRTLSVSWSIYRDATPYATKLNGNHIRTVAINRGTMCLL